MGLVRSFIEWVKSRYTGRETAPATHSPEDRLKELEAGYRLQFRRRLEAGIGLTLQEWAEWDEDDAGVFLQNLWLEERERFECERRAVESQFLASAIRGNILNEDAVYDRLPDSRQTEIVRQRAYVAAQIRKHHGEPL